MRRLPAVRVSVVRRVPAFHVPLLNFFHLFGSAEIDSAKRFMLRGRVKGEMEIAIPFERCGKLKFSLSLRDAEPLFGTNLAVPDLSRRWGKRHSDACGLLEGCRPLRSLCPRPLDRARSLSTRVIVMESPSEKPVANSRLDIAPPPTLGNRLRGCGCSPGRSGGLRNHCRLPHRKRRRGPEALAVEAHLIERIDLRVGTPVHIFAISSIMPLPGTIAVGPLRLAGRTDRGIVGRFVGTIWWLNVNSPSSTRIIAPLADRPIGQADGAKNVHWLSATIPPARWRSSNYSAIVVPRLRRSNRWGASRCRRSCPAGFAVDPKMFLFAPLEPCSDGVVGPTLISVLGFAVPRRLYTARPRRLCRWDLACGDESLGVVAAREALHQTIAPPRSSIVFLSKVIEAAPAGALWGWGAGGSWPEVEVQGRSWDRGRKRGRIAGGALGRGVGCTTPRPARPNTPPSPTS